MSLFDSPRLAAGERAFAHVNWLGLRSLAQREVMRFLSIPLQTVVAPAITSLLFLAIFTLVLASRRPSFGEIPFAEFIAPGMVMMAVIQNAFANTSSSLLGSKILGNIFDTLAPPLSTAELVIGYAAGGMVRGLTVAAATWLVLFPLAGLDVAHPFWAATFLLLASCLLANCGIIAGLWAEKFDHMSTVTNFFLVPMSFLSGSFYSVSLLPDPWSTISLFNPLFYLVDGFRFGVVGVSDFSLPAALTVAVVANLIVVGVTWRLVRVGYKIRN